MQSPEGSTVINLLKKQFRDKVEIISQHGNARSSEKNLPGGYKDYFTFGFVRSPWDRILSWSILINKRNQKNLDEERPKFEKFIELDYSSVKDDHDFHYNQIDYFSNKSGELLTNKIYRFENYESEVNTMLQDLDLSIIDIQKKNELQVKNYRDYYTLKSQKRIVRKCKKDIAYFNYKN